MNKKQRQQITQEAINQLVDNAIHDYNSYMLSCGQYESVKPLRSCQAKVYTTERYYALQSYSTIIAIIDRETDTLYDFLRYVYCYTATSAQHIRKFENEYGTDKWGCHHVYTWRAV